MPIANFTVSPSATGTPMTLDALMARQREIAEARANAQAPRTMMTSPWQLVGGLAEQFANRLQEGRVERQLGEGRSQLAQLLSGVNPETGATSEQAAQIYALDPEAGARAMESAADAVRARREQAAALAQRTEDRGWSVEDREDAQRAAAELAAGKVEQWEDIPASEGAPAGQRFQRNRTTGEIKAVGGGGVNVQLLSPETGARVGLGDEFLRNYETVLSAAKAGQMTGPIDFTNAVVAGRGPGGAAYRMLKQGSEALVRQMTGAGMSQGEAVERAAQYEPQITDDADVLASKVEGLKNALEATRAGATFGRNAPPAPDTATPPPPPPQEPPAGGAYEVGQTYTFDEGTFRYKGGDATKSTSWEVVR